MDADGRSWIKQFQIESTVDLDFVIGQGRGGYPVGMQSGSPAEFRRRILAAKLSYELQLKSVDYTLKNFVDADLYESEDASLGASASHYLSGACQLLQGELASLHTQGDLPFGVFGAELTIFRLPNVLDTARILSNRGLLLEVLPLLRLCLEMLAWAHAAYFLRNDDVVADLKAQNCVSSLKTIYKSAGRLYGYLSKFAHWGHAVHGEFLHISEGQTSILNASVRYRAMSLALCLVVLDVFVAVLNAVYLEKSEELILKVQGAPFPDENRKTYQMVSKIADATNLSQVREIHSFLQAATP